MKDTRKEDEAVGCSVSWRALLPVTRKEDKRSGRHDVWRGADILVLYKIRLRESVCHRGHQGLARDDGYSTFRTPSQNDKAMEW